MAEGKSAPVGLPPEAAEVLELIARGASKSAVESAKLIHKRCGTPATEGLLVDAYCARIGSMLDHRLSAEAEALVRTVREKYPASAARLDRLRDALRTSGAGLDETVRALADPASTPEARAAAEAAIRTTLADPALLAQCRALEPGHPLRVDADTVRLALEAAASGMVDDATLALPEISRRSPLAPWKPLVRAIACYYRREDAACREHLRAIAPDSAAARLKPAIEALVGAGDSRALAPAAAALVDGVRGDLAPLRAALADLERACDEEEPPRILEAIRKVFALAHQECPEIVPALRRQVSVRAMLSGITPDRAASAMGGMPREDARHFLLMARTIERLHEHPLAACDAWEQFRRAALREKWFPAQGPEVAILYLHMAGIAAQIAPEDIEAERQEAQELMRLEAQVGFETSEPALEHLHAEWLLQRACEMDPSPEAFLRWVEWAERSRPAEVQTAAEAWHKACPGDPRPLLRLMDQAEQRKAWTKAMGYLRRAERIDGVNAEVRRARLRLLIRGAIQHLKKNKLDPARKELAELEALPQAREGDRPAFVEALRAVDAHCAGKSQDLETRRRRMEELLGGPLAAAILFSSAACLCGRDVEVDLRKTPGKWIESICRALALISDMGFSARLPFQWKPPILAELRKLRDPDLLDKFGRIALRQQMWDVAFAASSNGLSVKGQEARFLFLRAQALPGSQSIRAEDLLSAAATLAHRNNDRALEAEVRQYWNERTMAGAFGSEVPGMSDSLLHRVLNREHGARYEDEARGFLDPFETPRRRRRRRRTPDEYLPF